MKMVGGDRVFFRYGFLGSIFEEAENIKQWRYFIGNMVRF
jgi:hypothetical protein